MAARLGVKVGKYTHSISNAHVYDIHYDAAKTLIGRKNRHEEIKLKLKKDAFTRAIKGDKSFVVEVVDKLNSQYKPMDAIAGLQIVL